MQRILKHCFPGRDLTLPTLRSIASDCDQRRASDTTQPILASITAPSRETESISGGRATELNALPTHIEDDVDLQEIVDLHNDLGCMIADGRGEYRISTMSITWSETK
jgi:hypothetical protein